MAALPSGPSEVIIIGAGIGGLTLGLALERVGIPFRIFEAAREIRPVGVGLNLLPHATGELAALGLEEQLARCAIATHKRRFFNRFGQLVHEEVLGLAGGAPHAQFSIHRADLQRVLLNAVIARAGADRVVLGQRCTGAISNAQDVTVHLADARTGASSVVRGCLVVGADGIHSALRRQLYPDEGPPRYSGVNMWRGVTRWRPIAGGSTMILAGCLATGQAVIYPIRNDIDDTGRQLVNWVFEMETPDYSQQDWNRPGRLEDFLPHCADWRFDWLDVPAFLRAADMVLEFPMVDRDPLPRWSYGRLTLLGDAAHPMVPRGSNGACQAILDAVALAEALLASASEDPSQALLAYQARRLEPTAKIVLTNRTRPPDVMLNEVHLRSGGKPFDRIEDIISREEILRLTGSYVDLSRMRETTA